MSSAIRDWLSNAQAAEIRGDKPEAIRFLRLAAKFYFEQRMTPRGEQMLRQIRRLEGQPAFAEGREEGLDDPPLVTDDDLGFGDDLLPATAGEPRASRAGPAVALSEPLGADAAEPPVATSGAPLPLRQATLADPRIDAWCSFCCRPKQEVGQLIAGPAGAFICGACVLLATELLGDQPEDGDDS